MTEKTQVERVQDEFIAAIQKDGILHTFEWAQGWFKKVAQAQVQDELERALGEHAKNPEARGLHAMDMMMSLATSAANFSTSASKNLMAQSRLESLAQILDHNWGDAVAYGSRVDRSRRWKELRAQLFPSDSASAG